ncbi:MAG: serine/threonine protein kinase, partial [Thiovulaceae bacterium]|nr:serine/threonine protein kinase [Sulfurimonadaceae bacterium]
RKRNFLYNVTEYIEGQTLTQWMIDHPHPALEIVREITLQIARGLYTLHKQEMIHQDLRPENILIDSTGTVKIIDLGSVRVEGITDINMYLEQESLLGTALYSAPEYFLGKIGTPKSDLFALATIVYEMLTGHYPYGVNMARCKSKSEQKKLKYTPAYQYNPTVAIWIDESLKKALQVDPYNRYDELSEFLYDLRHPNKNFINKKEAPLLERNPVLFWKSVSITLMGIIIFLVSK